MIVGKVKSIIKQDAKESEPQWPRKGHQRRRNAKKEPTTLEDAKSSLGEDNQGD